MGFRPLARGWARGLTVAAVCLASTAWAQTFKPDHPIRVLIPVPAGSAPDLLSRIVSQGFQAKWGQPGIVEPHPGASQNIAGDLLNRAEPDGYTIMTAPPPPFAVNQHLFPKLTFDPTKFSYITVLVEAPNVMMVRAGLPAKTIADVVALAKAKPGGLTYGSTGPGSTLHLTGEAFKSRAGVDITHVPYKGTVEIIADMLGDRIDMAFINLVDAWPQITAGKLRPFAVGSAQRNSALPDVPTLRETWPDFVSVTWFADAAPPNTPAPVVAALNDAIKAAFATPEARKIIADLHATPMLQSPAEATAYIKADSDRWREVIQKNNIRIE
jgi:tripartite-type tricarboxylate transporter receptor subunit TctC